jgi:hypothetical protein
MAELPKDEPFGSAAFLLWMKGGDDLYLNEKRGNNPATIVNDPQK